MRYLRTPYLPVSKFIVLGLLFFYPVKFRIRIYRAKKVRITLTFGSINFIILYYSIGVGTLFSSYDQDSPKYTGRFDIFQFSFQSSGFDKVSQ